MRKLSLLELAASKPKRNVRQGSVIISVILVIALLALGVIVGGVAIRHQLVQEFGDAATALDHLDQSYSYSIRIDANRNGNFDDDGPPCSASYNDPAPTLTDPDGAPSAGIVFTVPTDGEGPAPMFTPVFP